MIRAINYFNIFFPPVFFLLFFNNDADLWEAAGLISVIFFSILLIKHEESGNSKRKYIILIAGLLVFAFVLYSIVGLIQFITNVDPEFLTFRQISFAALSLILCLSAAFQLVHSIKRVSV